MRDTSLDLLRGGLPRAPGRRDGAGRAGGRCRPVRARVRATADCRGCRPHGRRGPRLAARRRERRGAACRVRGRPRGRPADDVGVLRIHPVAADPGGGRRGPADLGGRPEPHVVALRSGRGSRRAPDVAVAGRVRRLRRGGDRNPGERRVRRQSDRAAGRSARRDGPERRPPRDAGLRVGRDALLGRESGGGTRRGARAGRRRSPAPPRPGGAPGGDRRRPCCRLVADLRRRQRRHHVHRCRRPA